MTRIRENSIKAVLSATPVSNGRRLDDKELCHGYRLIAVRAGQEPVELVAAYVWTGRSRSASTLYAALWVTGDDAANRPWLSGSGRAGGWGYHKTSAAIDSAIYSAGIELFGSAYSGFSENAPARDWSKKVHIDGVGDEAIERAIVAIGQACGYELSELIFVHVS